LFPAQHCPLSNSSTSSAAPLIAPTAFMFALFPTLLPCRKPNRLDPNLEDAYLASIAGSRTATARVAS
jgi:hypothetical protein